MNKKLLLAGVAVVMIIALGLVSFAQHHYLNRPWINTSIAEPMQYYQSQDFSTGLIYDSNENEHDPQPLLVYSNQNDDEQKQDH